MSQPPAALQERSSVRIGLVGGGFMGAAIISGLMTAGLARAEDLSVAEAVEDRRRYLLGSCPGIRVSGDLGEAVRDCAAVLIAVKPQDFAKLGPALAAVLSPGPVVISIMAGIPLGVLVEGLSHARVVRVMPNTPASLGEGFSAWIATDQVTAEQRELTRSILRALGREAEMHEERYVDMATALSGSGPAYVFLFLEALISAGVSIGLPRPLAADMAMQTISGSLAMARASGEHPAALRDAVTSPAGTTAAALQVLERAGIRGIVTEAVTAAYERSKSLGG